MQLTARLISMRKRSELLIRKREMARPGSELLTEGDRAGVFTVLAG